MTAVGIPRSEEIRILGCKLCFDLFEPGQEGRAFDANDPRYVLIAKSLLTKLANLSRFWHQLVQTMKQAIKLYAVTYSALKGRCSSSHGVKG